MSILRGIGSQRSALILLATMAAFVLRGLVYASIGSWLPALLASAGLIMLALGWFAGARWWKTAVRLWAFWLIVYALVRIALAVSIKLTGIDSVQAIESTGPWYYVTSILYLLAGVLLWRAPVPASRIARARH